LAYLPVEKKEVFRNKHSLGLYGFFSIPFAYSATQIHLLNIRQIQIQKVITRLNKPCRVLHIRNRMKSKQALATIGNRDTACRITGYTKQKMSYFIIGINPREMLIEKMEKAIN
jgi:hypothetical protein